MGVLQQTIALLLLHVLVHGGFLIVARDVEVALSADSSILDDNGPLETMIQDPQIENEGTQVIADEPGAGKALGTKKAAVFQEVNTVEDVMTTLQRELAAVDQMVKLQEKKLQVLQEMRIVRRQGHEEKTLEEGDITKRRRVDIGDVIDRKLDAIVADTAAAETARDFATYFVETSTIGLRGEVADMKMTKIRHATPTELIAVAYKVGVIEFYTSTAELLLSVDTKKNGIKFIALELQDDQPCLVVTYETSSIGLYELFLLRKDSRETESGVDGKTEQPLLFTISTGPEYQLSVSRYRRVDLSAKTSAVAIARASRQLVVAVAKDDGIIDFLAFNGTSLRQMLTQASISAMETRRNMLAFSNGTNVVVSSLTRAQGSVFHSCPGSSSEVSSIAFDTIHPDIMYTGTQRGEILVYSVSAGLSAESQACKLLSRSMVSQSSRISPVMIATTKSYVIAAGVQDVTVFNVSRTQRNGVSLSRICLCNTQSVVATAECQQLAGISSMTFSEGAMESHLAFVSAGISGRGKLILFHSLLPDEREVSAFQWTVFVYAGLAAAAVIGSQLFIKWQRRTNVNPWDSIKRRDSPYGKYDDFKGQPHTSEFAGEDFGRYDSLSDELRRKIAQQKRDRPMDDDTDY